MTRRLVITGASGFLGGYLVEAAVATGWHVEAWYRRHPGELSCPAVQWRQVDIGDEAAASLQLVGEPPAAIVHAAALAHSRPGPDMAARVRQVNVEGTRRVLQLASSWQVSRVVLVSSVLAGSRDEGGESDKLYGQAKRQAEALVRDWTAESRAHTGVALRLPLLYGPGVRANFGRLVWLASRGCALHIGGGVARRTLLAAPNAASAVLATLEEAVLQGGFHRFTVTDARPYSLREIGETLCHAAHLGAVPLWGPRAPLRLLARLGDMGERWLGRPLPWSSEVLAKLDEDAVYDGAPFEAATGWRPTVDLTQLAPAILEHDAVQGKSVQGREER